MSRFQTDALRPAGLPSANLGRPRHLVSSTSGAGGSADSGEGSSKTKFWDDWNLRIDGEVRAVAEGLGQLVELADIGKTPTPHTPSLISLHLPLRTSQLIKATQQLRDTAHELRLMLLLSDEVDIAAKRDEEARRTRRGIQEARGEVVEGLRRLMGATEDPPDTTAQRNGDHPADTEDEPKANGATASSSTTGAAVAQGGGHDGMEVDGEAADEDEDEEGDFEEVG